MLHRLLNYFRYDLAVDLGTANTLIGLAGEGLVLNEPSVVAVEQGTRRILSGGCAVGHLAKQMQGRTPESISVVRPLARGVITDYELCESMLRYFLRKAKPPGLRRKPRVLVAVPGCITPVERRAVFNSFQRAGARQVWLIGEATAAAIGVGMPIAEPVASMVVDVGGGTTETAVLSLADVVAGESIRTGGDEMDRAVVDYLKRHYSLRVGLPAAERLRIELGSAYPLDEEQVTQISGIDTVSGLPRQATVTSEEIRQALGDPLEAIIEAIKATLDGCSPDLAADLVSNGLVLCGGGSLLRRMDRFITEQTGLPARVAAEPLTAVVAGMSICLEHLDRWRPTLQSSDDEP
ncbi:MAG: rod shape-determining protein [Candidatus Nealsonbacteria bacterium]|nr:rod shape-determining protein [Candidatus Nealsonbacteria bacterium]